VPRIGVSITKSISFRGATQEFSNVYFYEILTTPDVSGADAIIDNLTTLEKTFHSSAVTFVRGRLWLETGNKATSEMISQKNLSGTGARTTNINYDPERAFLFRLRAGVDSRGNPVYLRKWYHSNGPFNTTVAIGSGHFQQTSAFTSTERTQMAASMAAIGDANGSAGSPKICSKGGRLPTAGQIWTSHQWLEHHQLGDMWRAT
jgi:hypothetical protein